MRDCIGYFETPTSSPMQVYALPNHYHRKITFELPALPLAAALGVPAPLQSGQARRSRPQDLLRTRTRLRLAPIMALCYSQLQSTPWLDPSLDKSNISFMCYNRPDASVDLTAPFVTTCFRPGSLNRLPSSSSAALSDSSGAISKTLALMASAKTEGLFALGKLLVELAFNTTLENMYEDQDKVNGRVFEFTPHLAAKRLLPEIYDEYGYLYGEAVRRCIEGVDVREKAVENPEFRQAFYRDIYQPLRDTSDIFGGKP
jgi:hypothetical protein